MKSNLLKPVFAGVVALGLGGWLVHSFNAAYEEQPLRLQGQIEAQQ